MDFLTWCPAVTLLSLSGTPIGHLPEGIRQMEHLRLLFAEKLSLEELPDWLPELGLSIGRTGDCDINFDGTTVKDVEMSTFDQSQEMIRAWFASRKKAQEGSEEAGGPLRQIKVVFLGDGSTGKSLTVARLLNEGKIPDDFDGEATPGIDIEDHDYVLPDGRKVQVHFWDFGGQEILHSMHRIFLTDRTMYVVMINARNNTQETQARYWLHNVKSFAPDCPVLLVLNQIDQNPNASVNERSLKNLYPNLKGVIRLSALVDDQERFNRSFTDKMLEQIAKFETLEHFFPIEWTRTMGRVRQMKGNYIRGAKFREICRECGVEGDKLRLNLLKWFHDIGVSFCCGNSQRLRDYVVLNPEWITNGIYTIIWNKHEKTANGMVDREEIYRLLNPGEGDNVQQVRRDMTYGLEDVSFVLDVSRKFRLSFRLDDKREFIPMLCDANALPIADTFPREKGVQEFRLEYDYLPMNVLYRLMVDMRQDLDFQNVWLTGAMLEQKYNGVKAMVKSEGNVLSIYIQATDRAHKAHTYLNTIRGALDAIHLDMGLKKPVTKVAYTEDGETEYFIYQQVEGSRRNDQATIYSVVLDKMVPIEAILNGTDSVVEEKKEKLLRDMAGACVQLLENRKMVEELKPPGKIGPVAENDRNDELCRALRNMGYHVADQTRAGYGSGKKQAGSLDMRLLHEDNLPWTTIEAMNLHSASDTQLAYWDDHLDRLLNNYDRAGLPMLFLISYVNCKEEDFNRLFSAYYEHMKQYSPPNCELRREPSTEVNPLKKRLGHLRVNRCTYDRSGTPVVVYHYFVGFISG
jgi:small GTP-binding protein